MRRRARAGAECSDTSVEIAETYDGLDRGDPGAARRLAELTDRQWCGCEACWRSWVADARGRLRADPQRRAAVTAQESTVVSLPPRPPT